MGQGVQERVDRAVCIAAVQDAGGLETYDWTNDGGNAEVDFLIDTGSEAVPVEFKAEPNLKSKILKTFCEKNNPKFAIRTSMSDYRQEESLSNLPLWTVESVRSLFARAKGRDSLIFIIGDTHGDSTRLLPMLSGTKADDHLAVRRVEGGGLSTSILPGMFYLWEQGF